VAIYGFATTTSDVAGIYTTIIIGSDRGDLTLSIITLLTVRSPI